MGCGNSTRSSDYASSTGKLSQESYDIILAEFMTLDTDSNQKLSRAEFEQILALPGHEGSKATDITRLFNTVDLDQSQTVDLEEFLEHMKKQRPWIVAGISEQSYNKLFTKFVTLDSDGDHKLSRAEFENIKGLPGHLSMQSADVTHLFNTVDVDHDQAVSLQEFIRYMSTRKDYLPLPVQIDPQKERLKTNMLRFGFDLCTTDGGRIGVDGDGNCQFYSLSWHLHKTTKKHAEVRSKIIEHLKGPGRTDFSVFYAPTHPSQPSTFDGFLDVMAKDRTWGDQLTLQAAANVFNLKVLVLTADQFDASARPILVLTPQQISTARPAETKTVWVSFAALHYSPIEPTSRTPKDLLR